MEEVELQLQMTRSISPKIRFKEFEDTAWSIKKASEIFTSSRVKGSEELPLFSVTIDRGMVSRDSVDRILSNDAKASENLLVPKGAIAYNMMRMWQGSFGLAPVDCMVSPAYVVLCPRRNVSAAFFVYHFRRLRNLHLFTSYSYGITMDRLRLYFKDFAHIKFSFPSLPEQQKIASFLSAVDEKIQLLTRKRELLEQYKKGVMQQLFSGKLRFKDEEGKDYPKWEERFYGEVFTFHPTNSLSRDALNYVSGNIKNIHYGDLHTKFRALFDIEKEQVPYINESVDLSRVKDESFCKLGDLVIADASEDYDDIGKSIEVTNLNGQKVLAGLHTFLARPASGVTFIGFSGYLMQSEYVRKQIKFIAQGTKVLSISTGRLAKIKIKLPCIEEQAKIADFISSLDMEIAMVSDQISHTQTFKKGLLQQMFV